MPTGTAPSRRSFGAGTPLRPARATGGSSKPPAGTPSPPHRVLSGVERGSAEQLSAALGAIAHAAVRSAGTEDCVVLVEEFLRRAYPGFRLGAGPGLPGGPRPAGTVDDSVVGVGGARGRLVQGPGWSRVPSWEYAAEAMRREAAQGGAPAVAVFVQYRSSGSRRAADGLVAVPGHAWAAVAHPDGTTWWLELQATGGPSVSPHPPPREILHTHAAVIVRGRVVLGALDRPAVGRPGPEPFARVVESESPSRAGADAPVSHSVGAVGTETEDRHPITTSAPAGAVLARHTSGAQVKVDSATFLRGHRARLYGHMRAAVANGENAATLSQVIRPIAELMLPPMASIRGREGERTSQATGAEIYRSFRNALARADREMRPIPLGELLTEEAGWSLTAEGQKVLVYPAPDGPLHPAYTQYTVGVPVAGLRHMLAVITAGSFYSALRPFTEAGNEFGRILAAHYLGSLAGAPVPPGAVPFLSDVEGVDELWGYGWLFYVHAAAVPLKSRFFGSEPLMKNMLLAASRSPMYAVRDALPPSVRNYLEGNEQFIKNFFVQHHNQVDATYSQRNRTIPAAYSLGNLMSFPTRAGGSLGDYLDTALTGAAPSGSQISQNEVFGMVDYGLDTDGGRLEHPLVLLEARHYGRAPFVDDRDAWTAFGVLDSTSAMTYDFALTSRIPVSQPMLRSHVRGVAGSNVIRDLSGLLQLTSTVVLARQEGLFLPPRDAREVYRALGAFAGSGAALSPGSRTRLTRLLDRVSALDPAGVPGVAEQHLRNVIAGARRGLAAAAGAGPGGSRGDDPVASRWPVGQAIVVDTAARGSVDDRRRLGSAGGPVPRVREVQQAPAGGGGKGRAVDPGVFTFSGWYTGRSAGAGASGLTFSYTVTGDGRITLPDGRELEQGTWVRHGPDFLHTTEGAVLYGDSGWLGAVENWETLSQALDLAALRPYRLGADAAGLSLTPIDGGPSVVIGTAWRKSVHSRGADCVEVALVARHRR